MNEGTIRSDPKGAFLCQQKSSDTTLLVCFLFFAMSMFTTHAYNYLNALR